MPGYKPPTFLIKNLYTAVPLRELVTDRAAVVGRSIIHAKDFQILIALRQNAPQALRQIVGGIIDRYDDGYFLFHACSPYPSLIADTGCTLRCSIGGSSW